MNNLARGMETSLPLTLTTTRCGFLFLQFASLVFLLLSATGCGPAQEIWHSVDLSEEFTAKESNDVTTLEDYQALEKRLFIQLDDEIYAQTESGTAFLLNRYSSGSLADPRNDEHNWNRSFEMPQNSPIGGVLLLHGMSDSPYSIRTLAQSLHKRGYWILGLRMPGHGTAPAGLVDVKMADMLAATRLGMTHLYEKMGDKPVHMIGYSTGATLALNFSLDAMSGNATPIPASLILISPAIRIHGAAGLAVFRDGISVLPGLGGLAWLNVMPEFDPYKYNSFATNAARIVNQLTTRVDERIASRVQNEQGFILPPVLVFKSAVDHTVTTKAVVDNLLIRLRPNRHHLVLYDINRVAAGSVLINNNSGPLTARLLKAGSLPFTVTFIGNESTETQTVVSRRKPPFTSHPEAPQALDAHWPPGVLSLSHVALPIPPDDPLYGQYPPVETNNIYLGNTALRGEIGLHRLPANWLLRMRYNPFYESMENSIFEWLGNLDN